MIKVKICGITNLEDAKAAIDAGCDALGFAFYKKSPRYIAPENAREIIRQLPQRVVKIGVFVNAPERFIKKTAKLCGLSLLQFHGDESPEFCRRFKGYKIIKVFRVKDSIDLAKLRGYDVFGYLFDTYSARQPGGTGKRFDWDLLKNLEDLKKPVFLSGGLSSRNVQRAISIAHPSWVDVCSSVELRPGKKDHVKVKRFIQAAKGKK